jgi:hypothetical protein
MARPPFKRLVSSRTDAPKWAAWQVQRRHSEESSMRERCRPLDMYAASRRLIFGLLVGSVSAAGAADGVAWAPRQDWFTYGVALVVLAASVLSLLMIRSALMGTVVILLLFLGFGAVAIFSFASTGSLPKSMDQVVSFLLAGLTLFAPYAVNKFSKVFEGLMPGKK